MKKLITSAILGFALLAISATAQTTPIYAQQALGTFTVAAGTASNVVFVIDCRKQATVTLCCSNQMSTSATDVQHFAYSRSLDGVSFTTAPFQLAAFTPIASTASVGITNLSTAGCGYIRIEYMTNAAASAIATNALSYAVKIGAP